jgi:hypothetical protein
MRSKKGRALNGQAGGSVLINQNVILGCVHKVAELSSRHEVEES